MNKTAEKNIIASYQTYGGFVVHDCEMLKKIYKALGINPKGSLDSRIYELEGITHFFQRAVVALANRIAISESDYVLSPGEGAGAPSRLLVKMFKCKVIGIDVNPAQISKARKLAFLHGVQNNVKYYQKDVNSFCLAKKDFTKAFINETCVHWQQKERAFKNINQHLVKGAKIGLNLWLKGYEGTLNDAYKFIPEFRDLYKEGIWFQDDLADYKKIMESAGFRIIYAEDCTDKIDIKIRARLMAEKQWEIYENILGPEISKRGINYYKTMLKVHYDFLRYGVLTAEKI